jgi:predicted Zn-dependent protease
MTLAKELTILQADRAIALVEETIKKSSAEGVFVSLSTGEESLSRYSENQITQNITRTKFNLTVTSYFGKRSASASTTELDMDAIAQTIQRSQELAKIAPEDPEWVPLLDPQTYDQRTPAFDLPTVTCSPLKRGEIIQRVCHKSAKAGVEASGTLSTEAELFVLGNSQGLRAYNQTTEANFGLTIRVENGSSWSERTAWGIDQLPVESISEELIDRAFAARNPRDIKPGIYPVIFNSAAFAELLAWVIWNLDARAADEGRSFMSRNDGEGNRLGEAIFSPLVQVNRDPAHPLLQTSPCFSDGLSNNYLQIIKDGTPNILSYSRYWAQKQGKSPTGYFSPIVMNGSEQSLTDLIAQTEHGILVNRVWYTNYVNPKTLEITGMTRDGTFWIENGKIAYPIKNLRFNQKLPEMMQDIDLLTTVERYSSSVVPGVRVKAFNFSSVSDSV